MRNEIFYEWVIEELDEHGDIHDVDHCQTFAEAHKSRQHLLNCQHINAVDVASRRSVGNELDGLHYWGYAYVDFENFTIEPKYCSGDKVPKHVIKQVVFEGKQNAAKKGCS